MPFHQGIIESVPQSIFVVDSDFTIVEWNSTMANHSGVTRDHALGSSLFQIVESLMEPRYKVRLELLMQGGPPVIFSAELHGNLMGTHLPNGDPREEQTYVTLRVENDQRYLVFTVQDVTSLKREIQRQKELRDQATEEIRRREQVEQQLLAANRKLEEFARTDHLTGLPNRRWIIIQLEQEKRRHDRYETGFCVIMGDIDHFKDFNDHHGHDCGDYILKSVATHLRTNLRDQDLLGRWGGEEFIMLCPETSLEGAKEMAERLVESLRSTTFPYRDTNHAIHMTFGVAEMPESLDSVDALLRRADEALYSGKAEGRDRVVVYRPSMKTTLE